MKHFTKRPWWQTLAAIPFWLVWMALVVPVLLLTRPWTTGWPWEPEGRR